MRTAKLFCFLSLLCSLILLAVPAFAQSSTAGDITGVVSDPTGAVMTKANVKATNDSTGDTHTTTTNSEGIYRFSLLKPGAYTVSGNATGFKASSRKVQVVVGQVINVNLPLALTEATTIVEVTGGGVQIDNADLSTNFSLEQVAMLPNPGNDLSAVAQTAPGVVMNTQSGFGNFSTYGLPGTSNLFTFDGMNDNDPFLNLNNSGATNLLLGANDVQEVTVTNNGYSGQFGQLAGSQVNYVSKSGGNKWHGNAVYWWNGRALNANDYRNNIQVKPSPSVPRPFDNVNQWAASIGGPIQKDKTWFFFNYEGLRVVLPTSGTVRVPSNGFETATIAKLMSTGHAASVPFFQNMFSLYNGTPGRANGTPDSCVFFSGGPDCALIVKNTATNFTHEYQMNLRIDHKFTEKDSIFARIQTDRGVQATSTDRINPIFNTQSTQPEYQGQVNETHVFNANTINEAKLSVLWYSAIFDNADRKATLAAFPTTVQFFGGDFSRLGGIDFFFPQGRNVTQAQFVDDFVFSHGKHTWKFGVNYRRYDVTDFDYGTFTSGLAVTSVDTFFAGGTDFFQQNFPTRLSQPIALYGVGIYAQDEWRATRKLRFTFALRVDHNSNPVCQTNCFARLNGPFTELNHLNAGDIPYKQTILAGQHGAYPGTDLAVWQPRFGFAFSPFESNKTVIRGGIGIFSDSFPAVLVDNFSSNPPVLGSFIVAGDLSPAQLSVLGNVFQQTTAANKAFSAGFATGATFNQLSAVNGFVAPGITASDKVIRQPRYQEWNLEVQQDLGWNSVLEVNYVGNHGIFEAVQNNGLNGFDPGGFGGLPTTVPDVRFGTVNQIQSIGVSNYNGLVTSVRHNFKRGLGFQVNYTWSHAFDEISNGGLLPFNLGTAPSLLNPINPRNLRANYGNADYDVRHYFSANYVWDNSLRHLFKWGPNAVFSGWTVSGTLFKRSGLPYSIVDSAKTGTLNGQNFGGTVLATITGTTGGSCGKANATPDPTTGNVVACLNGNGFALAGAETGFGNQARNQFRGPGYFNTDLSIVKHTKLPRMEHGELAVGFQFFNLFNHPNFDQPVNDVAAFDPTPGAHPQLGSFGTIINTLNTPTSILGSFLGGDASPRLIQLKLEFKF